jgi:hypothetical protein
MISFKAAFSNQSMDLSESKFPERPEEVKQFFLEKELLLSFSSQQVDKVCAILAGRTVTPLDLTSILYRSIEEERKVREGVLSRSEIDSQKSDITKTVKVVKEHLRSSEV